MKKPCRSLYLVLVLVLLASLSAQPPLPTAAAPIPRSADRAPIALDEAGLPAGLPEGADATWLAAVQDDIRRSEYNVTWQDATYLSDLPVPSTALRAGAYQAPNRAQGFRAYFTEHGLRVIPRGGAAPAWEVGLAVQGAGPAGPAVAGNRVEYVGEGGPEWYINGEMGLGQGITIRNSNFELRISTDLIPRLSPDGATVELVDASGTVVLRYGPFSATDAAGRLLPVRLALAAAPAPEHFTLHASRFTLRISLLPTPLISTSASTCNLQPATCNLFPLTLHATLTAPQAPPSLAGSGAGAGDPLGLGPTPSWAAEGNQAGARFGSSVSTAGDVNGDGYADVVVAAPYYDNGQTDEGRVYVYHGSAGGLSPVPAWTAEGDQVNAWFGSAVGTAGDVNGDGYSDVVGGAQLYDGGQTDEGGAFAWYGSATGLGSNGTPANADWTAEGNQAGAYFGGWWIGTAGDVNGDGYADVIVGAPFYDNGQADEGAAFVYHGSASGLSPAASWIAESDQAGAWFGGSVATAGDVNGDGYADVIVGADSYDNGQTDEGRAYMYYGSAGGLYTAASWIVEGNQDGAHLGYPARTAGDINGDGYGDVVVGAYGYDNGESNEGRAYVYHGSAYGLSTTANWTAEGNVANANFGTSSGTAGDVNGDGYADVIVGAYQYYVGQGLGRAYVYHGSAGGLSPVANWTVEGRPGIDYWLGWSVGTAGDVNGDGYADVVVGVCRYMNGQPEEGAAFVYHGAPTGLGPAAWAIEGNQTSAYLGYAVGTAGDVNGDGYADVIVGAYGYDGGQTDEGAAFLYHGSAGGPSPTANWMVEGNQDNAYLGISVGTAGDVNGDGYGDVLVGAYLYDNDQVDEGRAYLYHGAAGGLPSTPSWTAEGDQASAYLGYPVRTAGDVNGDGYADVVVGAYGYDNGEVNEGRVYVYHGAPAGLPAAANWTAESDQASSYLGYAVGAAGDVNGDGYADVVVGAYGYDGGQTDEGAAFVYHGSAGGLLPTPSWTVEGNQDNAALGIAVGTAGDVNGDGYSDVVVGAYTYDAGSTDEGRAYVYHGSAGGLSLTPNWTAEGDQPYAYLGYPVRTAGDVNGDGYSDLLVGAYAYDNDQADEGRLLVYHGSSTGLGPNGTPTNADWWAEGDQAGAVLGYAADTAGDVNGDGYSDVIAGAHGFDNPQAEEGRALVYYGNASNGLAVRPQQRRADDSTLVAPGGQSISPTQARLATLARTPFGCSQLRLQWEVKPEGTPFNGTGLGQSAWQEGSVSGYAFDELVSGLSFERRYHWRVRIVGRPARAAANSAVTYRSRWLYGPTFFTALSGQQSIGGTGQTNLLGQAAYVNVTTPGTLTGLTLRGYPQTAHPGEAGRGDAALILDRYFTLTPNAGAAGFDLTLCLNYDDAELGAVPEAELLLCRWSDAEADYICRPRSAASSTALNLACADGVGELSGWVVAGLNPTAVRLVRLDAWAEGAAIHVEWETAAEVDNAGFHLYRREGLDGPSVRLNEALIPGHPEMPAGAVYSWDDAGVEAGRTYSYELEAVDIHGLGTLYGPVVAVALGSYRLFLPCVFRP